jgi:hypothetical protein
MAFICTHLQPCKPDRRNGWSEKAISPKSLTSETPIIDNTFFRLSTLWLEHVIVTFGRLAKLFPMMGFPDCRGWAGLFQSLQWLGYCWTTEGSWIDSRHWQEEFISSVFRFAHPTCLQFIG